MKKLILLFLVLMGMVSTVSATTATVYIKAASAPKIWLWGDGVTATTAAWPGDVMTECNFYGVTLYKYEVTYTGASYNFLVNFNGNDDQSADVADQSGDVCYSYTGTLNETLAAYDANIDEVQIRGDFDSWAGTVMTESAGVYSTAIDLSETLANSEFKVVVKNGSGDLGWLGWNANTLSLTDTKTLLSAKEGDWSNFVIANSNKTYKNYNISVSFTDPTTWSLTFAGDEARAHKTINVGFINNMGWDKVYAYTFDPIEQSGAWPGTEMTKNGTIVLGTTDYDYYSYGFEGYESYPTQIIFNDGTNQTADLKLYAGQAYSGPLYCVVGRAEAFGNWNAAATTAIMDPVGDGTYTFSQDDVVLGKDFDFKIIKRLYWGYNGDPLAWYPYTDNPSFSSTQVAGKYNMEFKFDPTADMSSQTKCWEGSTATKTAEAVTIGSTGWATTVTNSPLNFAGLTEDFKAYTATLAGTTVTLQEVANVQAETGLVLKGNEGTFYAPVIASSETAKGDLKHSSTYEWNVDDATAWCFGLTVDGGGNAKFAKVNDGETIPAQKAFLTTAPGGAHEFTVDFGNGGATGINTLNAERTMMNGEMYNLAGQKVNKSYKGIVINNGKKVMMK